MVINKKIRRYFELAGNIALQSTHKYRHGAVLVSHGRVVNTAFNSVRYSKFASRFYPEERKEWVTRHAELSVILNMPHSLTKGSVVYVIRINSNEEFMLSKPCSSCMDSCIFTGIKRIIFSIDENEYGIINLQKEAQK